MQFAINREPLLRPLQLVSGSLGGRPTLPILSNVLLEVSEDRLSMTGTDLEVEMIGKVALEGFTTPGRTTVPARKLLDICRGLPDSAENPEEPGCRPARRGRFGNHPAKLDRRRHVHLLAGGDGHHPGR